MRCRNCLLTILFLLFIVSLSALLISGCATERGVTAAPIETVSNVPVAVAQETVVPERLEVVGTVASARTSQISSQMMGNIVEIRAREGDRVARNQVLAVLDSARPRAAVQQARAAVSAAQNEVVAANSALSLASATLERYRQLYRKKSVSPQEFDEVKTRFESAQARRDMARAQAAQASAGLEQARTVLSYTFVRAPYPGVITQKMAEVGALASPGTPLFTIEDTRRYRLEVAVDESDIHFVRVGESVPVTIASASNLPLSGNVFQIVPFADPSSRSFLVKISLPPVPNLRSGLFGHAYFFRGKRQALLIPISAIVTRGDLDAIYVLGAGRIAQLRYVSLGQTHGNALEVLAGLQPGEKFVSAPGDRELAGKQITEQR